MNSAHLQATLERVLAILTTHHVGAESGISAQALARAAGVPERSVRYAVEAARAAGHGICAHPANGYFMPASAAEIERTCQFLRARALTSLVQVAALNKISLKAAIGQLEIAV